ncbi:MAG: siderophore-interacting protein [Pseudoxanthomonas sp.]
MNTFVSKAVIPMRRPQHMLSVVCQHFAEEEVVVTWTETRGDARFPFGCGLFEAEATYLLVQAEAEDIPGLLRLKNILAMHLEELAPEEPPEIVWTGDGCDVTELPNLRIMRVARTTALTPQMRRITLSGDDLARFASGGHHVKVLVPPEGVATPEWPIAGRNGRPQWPSEDRRPIMRTYTIRRIDVPAGEMDIDFVLHGDDGIASRWAAAAREGDVVGIMGPGGMSVREADWYLLAGDMTALPVISRLLEELPPTKRGVALIEIPAASEAQKIKSVTKIELRYLHSAYPESGNTTALEEAVKAIVFPDDMKSFVFVGAETSVARRLRSYLRQECGLDRSQHLCAAYWRLGRREGEGSAKEHD